MADVLLTTQEVADLFRVDPQTVTGWVRDNKLQAVLTPGGRRYRFRRDDVEAMLFPKPSPESESAA
jgi:excisionase family DNA binding protein